MRDKIGKILVNKLSSAKIMPAKSGLFNDLYMKETRNNYWAACQGQ